MSKSAPRTPAWWFGDAAVPWPMRALAPLYAGAVALRRRLYRSGWLRTQRVDVPVVVVGNLAAGGAGKTPLTLALVEKLLAAGWHPGVASRGYGRRDAGTPRWVTAQTATEEGGDEPVLIASRLPVPVRVDRDRVAAARALAAAGCDIVVCDDGLQHYRLARDIEIEVVDGARRYGNGRMLPAGPLREPAVRGRGCDFRVVNLGHAGGAGEAAGPEAAHAAPAAFEGDADPMAGQASRTGRTAAQPPPTVGFGEWPMRLKSHSAVPLAGGRPRPVASFAGQRVHAVAGIGNPQRFFDALRALGIGVVPHAFADHRAYTAADLDFGNDLPVLMTEKDAVKCAAFADERCFSVPVDAELPAAFWIALLDRLGRRD
ncbi:tetraacyldisaccharide 4'-kinase [Pseudoxanthomonas broegbernensis]|uniref:Tetraacyldisaccharide 4'-kinase n=1 Tax=Pseudoxanthomonas broegbernensis TaxID=83619 RepID=A0A7V8K5W7_9GAMM|nr:tetraacyldisaccharide 4'-kinase [Pseudoxanthomonas broegbernensis]KAF1684963.1 tetraacyldisaccharide 4'-kinase [Pseudoxanthomonas broegbernensis]MBB6064852.1 tetraacyldisaccharide 4'-kinase [Pseudoxanthomonas broegbernensis]